MASQGNLPSFRKSNALWSHRTSAGVFGKYAFSRSNCILLHPRTHRRPRRNCWLSFRFIELQNFRLLQQCDRFNFHGFANASAFSFVQFYNLPIRITSRGVFPFNKLLWVTVTLQHGRRDACYQVVLFTHICRRNIGQTCTCWCESPMSLYCRCYMVLVCILWHLGQSGTGSNLTNCVRPTRHLWEINSQRDLFV